METIYQLSGKHIRAEVGPCGETECRRHVMTFVFSRRAKLPWRQPPEMPRNRAGIALKRSEASPLPDVLSRQDADHETA